MAGVRGRRGGVREGSRGWWERRWWRRWRGSGVERERGKLGRRWVVKGVEEGWRCLKGLRGCAGGVAGVCRCRVGA